MTPEKAKSDKGDVRGAGYRGCHAQRSPAAAGSQVRSPREPGWGEPSAVYWYRLPSAGAVGVYRVLGAAEREAGGGPGSRGGGEQGEERGCWRGLCNPPPWRLHHAPLAISHTFTVKWSCRPHISSARKGRRLGQRLLLRGADGVPLPAPGAAGFYLQTCIAQPWLNCSTFGHLLNGLQCKALAQKVIIM